MRIAFLLIMLLPIILTNLQADIISENPDRPAVTIIKQDINGDGHKEIIELSGKTKGNYTNWKLHVTSLGNTFSAFNVLGLAARNGSLSILSTSEELSHIVVDGPIGENGWVLSIYRLTNTALERANWIFSDRPYIDIRDITQDGISEIIAFNRDYTTDPDIQNYIYTYNYDPLLQSWMLHSAQNPETGEMIVQASPLDRFEYDTPTTPQQDSNALNISIEESFTTSSE